MQLRPHRTRDTKTCKGLLNRVTRKFATAIALIALSNVAFAYDSQPINQLIVKFSPETRFVINKDANADYELFSRLSVSAKTKVSLKRAMSGHNHVIRLSKFIAGDDLNALISRLSQDPSIISVEPDVQILPQQIPLDTMFQQQWPLHSSAIIPAGMNLPATWDLIQEPSQTVVAVIDTGVLPDHIDLQGSVLDGFDFISSFAVGDNTALSQYPEYFRYFRTNDNDGRDADASDPGDWIDLHEANAMQSIGMECHVQKSTFHGTAMAGIIAGQSEHSHGIAGIDWNAKILPARVSGKCGGSRSDMVDAIRWAAGIEDPALPYNPTPAKIINMSLGSNASCGYAEQAAINEAWEAGAILVAAAGNSAVNIDESPTAPASCDNVIAVNAVRQDGGRAYYSNYGTTIDIAAPGGEDTGGDGKSMIVATNHGEEKPLHGSHYKFVAGTSGAAAHVSGVLSLMLSVTPALSNEELRAYLLNTSSQFTKGGYPECNKESCGTGVVNAYSAVHAAINGYTDDSGLSIGNAVPESALEPATITTGTSGGGCAISYHIRSFDPTLLALLILSIFLLMRRRRT